MMSIDNLENRISTAQKALRSFLATLLGQDAPLEIDALRQAVLESADERRMENIVFAGGESKAGHWAVVLTPEWLPLLSTAMLGEPIELGEPGAEDLLTELAAQAYGAVRTQLVSAGVTLPETSIALVSPEEELGEHRFAPTLFEIPFEITVDGRTLTGFAVVPPIDGDQASTDGDEPETAREDLGALDIQIDAEPSAQPVRPAGAASTSAPASPSPLKIQPAAFPDLGTEVLGGDGSDTGFELLADVELEVTVELGRRSIPLADVLRLTTGSVIELEKLVGEPLEVYANGRLIAEGEAVVMDEQFGIRITNLSNGKGRAKAFV